MIFPFNATIWQMILSVSVIKVLRALFMYYMHAACYAHCILLDSIFRMVISTELKWRIFWLYIFSIFC
jgi:hypothetical protein